MAMGRWFHTSQSSIEASPADIITIPRTIVTLESDMTESFERKKNIQNGEKMKLNK